MSAPSKEQFYQDLNENTFCGYVWCRKLYGFQMYDNAFLERVFAKLDDLGRSKVKSIYGLYFKWEMRHEIEQMKEAGTWLVERNQNEREREERECNYQKKILLKNLSEGELNRMLQNMEPS